MLTVYVLIEYDYDTADIIGVFADEEEARIVALEGGYDVEPHVVLGLDQYRERVAREQAEAEERERRRLADIENGRLNELRRLNSTPHSYPRPYRAPHRPSRESLSEMFFSRDEVRIIWDEP